MTSILDHFMGLNILFWNCQGITPKPKELELYLQENVIDVIALNETFFNEKVNFYISGYDTIKNDRSNGQRGGAAFLVKHGLVINKEYRNSDFSIITENEALAIDLELSDNQTLLWQPFTARMEILTFHFFNPLITSTNVMFVGDFNTFDQIDREVFESTLEEALGSADFSGHLSTSDLDKYADFIITAIHVAVDKAIPTSKSVRPESNPFSNETLALIKEKRRLRRQYSQKKDPAVKTRINQLQKQVKEELKVESLVSWEKFCNSISLENSPNESWCKVKNFLKPKGQRDYPALHHANKVAKTNADKAQLFAESVERHFGIESDYFDSNHFDEVNKFIEDNHRYFYPPEDPDDYRFDVGNEHELVADVDAQTLIKLVKYLLKEVKPQAPTLYTMRYLG